MVRELLLKHNPSGLFFRVYFKHLLLQFSCMASFTNLFSGQRQVDKRLQRTLLRRDFTDNSKNKGTGNKELTLEVLDSQSESPHQPGHRDTLPV